MQRREADRAAQRQRTSKEQTSDAKNKTGRSRPAEEPSRVEAEADDLMQGVEGAERDFEVAKAAALKSGIRSSVEPIFSSVYLLPT